MHTQAGGHHRRCTSASVHCLPQPEGRVDATRRNTGRTGVGVGPGSHAMDGGAPVGREACPGDGGTLSAVKGRELGEHKHEWIWVLEKGGRAKEKGVRKKTEP